MNISKFYLLSILLLFISCAVTLNNDQSKIGYDLSTPDERLILPDTLREVSGLCKINDTTFACIQDENGILFFYNLKQNEIIEQYDFFEDGDYEGIAKVKSSMFILRSDGVLIEIQNFDSSERTVVTHNTGIPAVNNEGLCYDEPNNRLLIAAKGKIGKGSELKDKRVIYGYDLSSNTLNDQPVYDFDLSEIKQFAKDHDVKLAKKKSKKGKKGDHEEEVLKFMTSAISIHPKTKKLYLLSAAEHLLFIFNEKGEIEYLENLDKSLFNKAEGITFLDNGDMLITNEGQNNQPTVLKFKYQK